MGVIRAIREINGKEYVSREKVDMRKTESRYIVQQLLLFEAQRFRLGFFDPNYLIVENFYGIINGIWKKDKKDRYYFLSFEQWNNLLTLKNKFSASIAKENTMN